MISVHPLYVCIEMQLYKRVNNLHDYSKNAYLFGPARRDHEKLYHCIADNGVGPKIIREINVDIVFKPKITRINKYDYYQDLKKDVDLECEVEAKPLADNFTWYKGSVQLSNSEHYHIINIVIGRFIRSTLRVIKIEEKDYGDDYMCSATNKIGFSYEKIALLHKS